MISRDLEDHMIIFSIQEKLQTERSSMESLAAELEVCEL